MLESFSDKVAGFKPVNLLKKRLPHSCFSGNFEKFFRAPFYIELCLWVPLGFVHLMFITSP